MTEPVPVSQEDREAAADLHHEFNGQHTMAETEMREGRDDNHYIVQAFALRAQQAADAERERIVALEAALTFIADLPDPGHEEERSATFYRIHAASLKQVAAKALGRETVSPEAFAWAEQWANSVEGRAALAQQKTRPLADFLAALRHSGVTGG